MLHKKLVRNIRMMPCGEAVFDNTIDACKFAKPEFTLAICNYIDISCLRS